MHTCSYLNCTGAHCWCGAALTGPQALYNGGYRPLTLAGGVCRRYPWHDQNRPVMKGREEAMSDDTALADLARALPERDWCLACLGDGPLRPWPLANKWGNTGELVCERCWLARVRGGKPACSYQGNGRLAVHTTHPQHGELFRGTIRAVGIEAHVLRPVTRWATADQDGADLGEYVGDLADAEGRLLEATAWADQISPSVPEGDRVEPPAGTA